MQVSDASVVSCPHCGNRFRQASVRPATSSEEARCPACRQPIARRQPGDALSSIDEDQIVAWLMSDVED